MSLRHSRLAILLVFSLSVVTAATGDDETVTQKLKNFIRVKTKKNGEVVAQLSIRTYKRSKDAKGPSTGQPFFGKKSKFKYPELIFVSMVHFAEASYYRSINQMLAGCDLVLYEAMGYDIIKNRNISKSNSRELLFQGSSLKKNATWELADLSLGAQQRALGMPGNSMTNQLKQMDQMLKLMGEGRFRKQLITQFKQMESMKKLLSMKFILLQRNSVAFGKLVDSIYKSKAKRIALVYGGAHMPDLEVRLKNELNYEVSRTVWLNAIHENNKAPQTKKPANKKAKLY
jgi:hypothetical protein